MKNVKMPEPDIIIASFTYKPVAPGYMFIMPRAYEDELSAIFLTLDPRVNLDDVSDYFMKENPFFSQWYENAEQGKTLAFSQYVYSPIKVPYQDRVLLAGDVGSCQELENTGAMISGWKAGNAIAAALKEEKVGIESQAVSDYLAWWKAVYLEGHPHEMYLMNFAMPYVIDSEEMINYIFSLIKDPLPPCYNPYAAMGLLGQKIQSIIPTIQQERPDIMAKLAKMSAPIAEALTSTTEACKPLADFE
jgi:flavin-dependent dehydrogenase